MTRRTTSALIVAAGQGSRAGGSVPKQYQKIAGKPLICHAIDSFLSHPAISEVVVVIAPGQEDLYCAAIGDRQLRQPVPGGETRRQSVMAGLAAIDSDQVLIHDAARPFVPAGVIDALIASLDHAPGAVPVLPMTDSVALRDRVAGAEYMGDAVDRTTLVRVQTPQAFHTQAIRTAHGSWPNEREATDDAQVLRADGGPVALVDGSIELEKVTYASDFHRLSTGASMISRTGIGFDVHAFGGGGPVWLGGIAIDHPRGLSGHSDADVALHAITDALLGAAALGDIGDHFPPSDDRWKGAPSCLFLAHAAQLIRERGGIIDHVDLTIIAEEPRIGPHRAAMREAIAAILEVDIAAVSVKATTTERLGFTGRREGIAAQAAATIRMEMAG